MATALQKQLLQIAEKSKSTLNAKAQKSRHSKSLIWDPKIAATQSFQKIYPVCYEGFEELCGLDSRFIRFRSTIFSDQSQNEDRTQLTEEENSLLDSKLESFLRLVGSRLHLMPAVKAVEWLVRRFRAHECNTSFLLTTFLPWHTLPVFVTLLSIIDSKQLPNEFEFLGPYIRSFTAPSRQVLVFEAIGRRVFLSRVSEYTLESCRLGEHYDALVKFWASIFTETVAGLVDAKKSGRLAVQLANNQDLLTQLGPIFSESLAMKKVPDLQIASYMALTTFVSKAQLSDAAVSAFMEQLAMKWTAETVRPGLICLAILSQYRSVKQVPKSIAKALLRIPDVEKHLVEIGREYHVDRFANGLCLAMVDRASKRGDPRGLLIVATLLKANLLTTKQSSVLFKSLLLAGTNLDEALDMDGSVRRVLGSMLVDLSRDPGPCGQIAQQAITDVDFDMEALEMKLDLSLRPARLLAAAEDEDVDMTDREQPPVDQQQLLHIAIQRLSTRKEGLSASLSQEPGPAFAEFCELFLQIAAASPKATKRLDEFENLPALRKSSIATDCTSLGFYIRIWCGAYPALARLTALERTVSVLKDGQGTDFQALLPYVSAALGDPSKKVRQAAVDLVAILSGLYEKSSGGKLSIWGEKSLYAGQQGWETINIALVAKFLDAFVVPSLEECILHPDHLIRVLDRALGSHKSRDGGDDNSHGKISQASRLALMRFFTSHILQTPILMVKERLLKGINLIRTIGTTTRTLLLLPVLTWWASLSPEEATNIVAAEKLSETDINQTFANVVVANDVHGLQALLKIAGSLDEARDGFIEAIFARMARMWQTMKPENKSFVADELLRLALLHRSDDSDEKISTASTEAAELLRNLDLSTEILAKFLGTIHLDTSTMVDSPPAKRRRLSNDTVKASHDLGRDIQAALTRATFVLQLVESSNVAAHADLLPALFSTLATLHNFRRLVGSDLGYLQNSVLMSLLVMLPSYSAAHKGSITIADGYGDTLVKCIQKSPSPVVQNSALLLVAGLAKIAPDVVIHCVMPIFTFMGVSVIRQNDDFSAHVVNEVIKEVVPPLLESLRKGKKNVVDASAELLLSFSSSYEHMPSHRRLGIFVSLAETMGVTEFLFALIALLVDKQGPTEGVLAFVRDLLDKYSVKTQLQTTSKFVELLRDWYRPPGPSNLATSLFKNSFAATASTIAEDKRDIALAQLTALPTLLSSKRLKAQTRRVTAKDDMEASEVRELYAGLLEKVLGMADAVKREQPERSDLYALCGESLASLLYLLSIGEFIKAVENLLDRTDMNLRQKLLKALEARVGQESKADSSSRTVLLGFLPHLTATIRDSSDIRYKHTAVACIDKIAEKYGEKDVDAVVAAAETISGESCLGQEDKKLRTMALLCLASLVEVLSHAIVPILPRTFSYTVKFLRESLDGARTELDDDLYCAAYTFALTVAQQMPEMMSSTDIDQILAISHASAGAELDDELNETRLSFLKSLALRLDANAFFTAMSKSWSYAAGTGIPAVRQYLEVLRTGISTHRALTIRKNAAVLQSIFLNALDFRRLEFKKGPVNESRIVEVEGLVNEVAIQMIFKLNDTTFQPMFAEFIDWSADLPEKDATGHIHRYVSLYSFLYAFFSQLGRFVLKYASFFEDHALRILDQASPRELGDQRYLWELILRVFAKCFELDEDEDLGARHWTSRFSVVAPKLMEQFRYATHIELSETLNPAIVELARAVSGSGALLKELNGYLLKQLRSEHASVRLAAVRCEKMLAARLQMEWVEMLPETLPFISELQDDDDEVVERETHAWIGVVEGVMGESLDSMLQ